MLIILVFYGIIFFCLGYLLKNYVDKKQTNLEKEYYFKLKEFNFQLLKSVSNELKKPNLFILNDKRILISSNINSALEEIFDFIILKYVSRWYLEFSSSEDFVVEIKYFFHIISSEILLRISKIDVVQFFRYKFIPVLCSHLDVCRSLQKSIGNSSSSVSQLEEMTLKKLKSHLHVSMISRSEEVQYLRSISQHIVFSIAPDYVNLNKNRICTHFLEECIVSTIILPVMDALANPDMINIMLCLMLEPQVRQISELGEPTKVPILHRYQQAWLQKQMTSKIPPKGLEIFLRDKKYFYHFLQYMKFIKAVTPVNFFKQIDTIMLKLLNPELDFKGKSNLFEEVVRLEKFITESVTNYSDLNITAQFHDMLKQIILDGPEKIDQLINCGIWMETYNAICQHAITVYLPQYLESEHYLATIYHDKHSKCDPYDKRKEFSMSKFGSTLKNALSFSSDTPDLMLKDSEDVSTITMDTDYPDIEIGSSHESATDIFSMLMDLPDLSLLRVKIPSISQRKVDKIELTFSIRTYKVDSDDLIARVNRKYADFYVLEQRLNEFHGNVGRSLPVRKILDMHKLDFLDKCKLEFETYLMFLINRPFLKNSQLVYGFLTEDSEFSNANFTDINIGRFVKSVPMKFAANKGQFLEPFLANFHFSCENKAQKDSTSNLEDFKSISNGNAISSTSKVKAPILPNSAVNSMINTRMHLNQYWNNASLLTTTPDNLIADSCSCSSRFLFSFYDVVCLIIEIVFHQLTYLKNILNAVLTRLRPLIIAPVDAYFEYIIRRSFEKVTSDNVAVDIIRTLKDNVLITGVNRNSNEKLETKNRAQRCIRNILPGFLIQLLPEESRNSIYEELDSISFLLQQPKLNKQVSYVLLDLLLLELFPDLADN